MCSGVANGYAFSCPNFEINLRQFWNVDLSNTVIKNPKPLYALSVNLFGVEHLYLVDQLIKHCLREFTRPCVLAHGLDKVFRSARLA